MWKFALLLAFCSCLCLVLPLLSGWAKTRRRSLLFVATILALCAVWLGRGVTSRHPASLADFRPLEVAGPADPYAASESCQACHPSQYDSWHASYHRTMTQVVTPTTVLGDFNDVQTEAYGHKIRLSQRGELFWATMHDPEVATASPESIIERPIVMSTGSHHMQVYWYATGKDRRLGQLPVVWLNETKSWVPIHSIFLRPTQSKLGSAEGRWNQTCIKCHTTQGRPRIDSNQIPPIDTHAAEFGIACEACHGPGTYHVAEHRMTNATEGTSTSDTSTSGTPTSGTPGSPNSTPNLVNPKELDHKRSSEVCGQCHGVWLAKDETETARALADGFSFRPGDTLADTRHVFSSGQPATEFIRKHLTTDPDFMGDRFWSDGMVRVSGREYNGLIRSPCFQKGEMSCVSCHDLHAASPHQNDWADDQLSVSAESNDACLKCHEAFRDEQALSDHTHHAPDSTGSLCYNCHMPYTTYGLLKAIRSHEVSSPSAQETVNIGRPNACNQCHVDQTLQWTATSLHDWYQIDAPEELSQEHTQYSATLLAAITGDAGQRALAASTLGWSPAQTASDVEWAVPVLVQLLNDPYHAVRFVALRSLKTYPNFENVEVDFLASPSQRADAVANVIATWRKSATQRTQNSRVLIAPNGDFSFDQFRSLLQKRNDRVVVLAE